MESEEGIRLRRQALRHIETKLRNRSLPSSSGDEEIKKEEEEQEQPLSPAGRLFHEPNFNVHVLAIMGCKVKIDPVLALANAKANLPLTLLKHPRFSSLPVSDNILDTN
ncbi:hypothetical protein TIFTF001_012116 [Ficus carica]|uniref:Uncharacterized protein n=1 Tax=Ficus carica TaxID=3494 RepID=A0AA88A153_FICCA|nr:hypothetical protein TIFTF001_012116 [Ficus carica]